MPHTILNGDCLTLLPTLADNCVDLIITDPPYSGVKKEKWDRQWKTTDDYLAWLRLVLIQCQRVLKANGSLYLFASPQMSARVEILVGGRFQVLNNIRWRKEKGRHKAACKEELRAFSQRPKQSFLQSTSEQTTRQRENLDTSESATSCADLSLSPCAST